MDLINTSQMEFAYIVGKIMPPQCSITLIVKGTFDLSMDQKVTLAEEQLSPTGDEFYEDDEDMQGGPRYASDFAYFKPRADLLLVGKCYAVKEENVMAQQCAFQVGAYSKALMVFGNRYWKRGLLGATPSDPEPFVKMDLRYENSYGGNGYPRNPVGKGYGKQETVSGKKQRLLPNILNLDDTPASPNARFDPAGFGPLGITWQQRQSLLGTYKGDYLKIHWPWFPADFDWGYFNSAPADMQVEGYLRGDEKLFFENVHPEYSQYTSELPGLKARCFLNKRVNSEHTSFQFDEVQLNMDTLWVDMETRKLVLIWRGWTPVQSEDLEEIDHIMVISEELQSEQPISYYEHCLIEELKAREKEWEIERIPVDDTPPASDVDMASENEKAEAEYRDSLKRAGLDPDQYPPPLTEKAKAEERQILKDYGIQLPSPPDKLMTRQGLGQRLLQKEPVIGEDLRHLDLSGMNMENADLSESIFTQVILQKSNLSEAKLSGSNLVESNLSGADLKNADLTHADLTAADLTGADLSGATLEDAILEGANLTQAVLKNIKGAGADFTRAVLDGAVFGNADLKGAELTKVHMDNSSFEKADLTEASIRGATGRKVNMDKANLTELRASDGCMLQQCSFREACARESIWTQADLTESDFAYANLHGADFSGARLTGTNFQAVHCREARFSRACLTQAVFIHANLFEALLDKTVLRNSDFRGANLYGAEFLEAELAQTRLNGANLKMTKLEHK